MTELVIFKPSSLICYCCYKNYSHEKMYHSKHSKTCYRLATQCLLRRSFSSSFAYGIEQVFTWHDLLNAFVSSIRHIIQGCRSEHRGCRSDSADAQADLHISCFAYDIRQVFVGHGLLNAFILSIGMRIRTTRVQSRQCGCAG